MLNFQLKTISGFKNAKFEFKVTLTLWPMEKKKTPGCNPLYQGLRKKTSNTGNIIKKKKCLNVKYSQQRKQGNNTVIIGSGWLRFVNPNPCVAVKEERKEGREGTAKWA